MSVIVDIQGFKIDENTFIVKEIAIASHDQLQVLLIKPPFPFYNLSKPQRRCVSWIERNRKIMWNEGILPYTNYKAIIGDFLKDKVIFCKGLEKIQWIKDVLVIGSSKVINLEDKGCPSIINLYQEYALCKNVFCCINHTSICALKNVLCLRNWCITYNLV